MARRDDPGRHGGGAAVAPVTGAADGALLAALLAADALGDGGAPVPGNATARTARRHGAPWRSAPAAVKCQTSASA